MTREFRDHIYIASFEVAKIEGDRKETFRRWFEVADECKQIANCIWQTWLVWHVQNGSVDKLRDWLNKRKEEGKKIAGKCPVQAVPNELSRVIYREVAERFPYVHSRVAGLIQNNITSTIKSRKASKGSLPGWSAILLCYEALPSFTSAPILYDKANSKIVEPQKNGENFKLELRVTRVPREGKKSISITDTVHLRCKGRKVQSQVSRLKKIVAGEYEFKGSQLVYSKSKGKWFAQICFQQPVEVRKDLDANKQASLVPHSQRPVHLIFPGEKRREWLIGSGRAVAGTRERMILQIRSRQHEYKLAQQARKGHGRENAIRWRWKFNKRWKDFTKLQNNLIATRAVRECAERQVGTLVYFQPENGFSEGRFLATAGKTDYNDATSWPWFQLKTFLERRCQEIGIELVTVKV